MNRRNFINGLLTLGAGFMVLPSAGRIWKAQRRVEPVVFWNAPLGEPVARGAWIVNPKWAEAEYYMTFPADVAGCADINKNVCTRHAYGPLGDCNHVRMLGVCGDTLNTP